MIRKAAEKDIKEIVKIYDDILTMEENENVFGTGWVRGMYPTEATARTALLSGTLFVCEEEGKIVAAAKIDQNQVPEYAECRWRHDAADDEVMVLHTLVVDPNCSKKGYGRKFVAFYERHALENNCIYLRMDTNKTNAGAREMYRKLGFKEAGIVTSTFNGIPNVSLVCLEKKL